MKTKKPHTHSQIMRHLHYRLWEQNNEGHLQFETYYNEKMRQLNDWLASKLPKN